MSDIGQMNKLDKILYKDETSSQKVKRVLYKWGKVLALPVAISLMAVPIYQYFHRQDGLESFLEETVESDLTPIEKVTTIEKDLRRFGVLEHLSSFEFKDFNKVHERVYNSFLDEMSQSGIKPEEIKDQVDPHSVLQMYFRVLKNEGFGYQRGSPLGKGVRDKKINCAISTLMFLSDLNSRLGLPVYGVDILSGESGHALLRYDNGKTMFHFDAVLGVKKNDPLLDNYAALSPDVFLHVILHNHAVDSLSLVWHKSGDHYRLSNGLYREDVCKSALVINKVAKDLADGLNPSNPRLHLTDSYLHLCLGDEESAKQAFDKFLKEAEEVPWEDYSSFIESFQKTLENL